MWEDEDSDPGVPSLQSHTEPVNGKEYEMYHGTSQDAAQQIVVDGFRPSEDGMLGRGVYLSRDLNKASRYPLELPLHERAVIRVKVNVGRVKKIDCQCHPWRKTWHDHGYDTAWCPPKCGMVPSGLEEDCVWDPSQITVIDIIPPCLQSFDEPVEGKVYTMFYGTTKENAEKIKAVGFQRSNGILGQGVYLRRDIEKACRNISHLPKNQRRVLRVKVSVGKVKKIECGHHPMRRTWHVGGFDTAWCRQNSGMVKDGLERDCVWDPERITVIDVIRMKYKVQRKK